MLMWNLNILELKHVNEIVFSGNHIEFFIVL